nr:hypothetical protein [Tanacetum cinerariifolium]
MPKPGLGLGCLRQETDWRLPQPLPITVPERRLTLCVLLQSESGYVFQRPHFAIESMQQMSHERCQPLHNNPSRQHGRMILESIEHGPLLWPTVEEDGVTRLKKYSELSAAEAIPADCDVKATNIVLQGLPPEVYALERECKLYDEFDKFAYRKGETLRDFYLRFSLLLNDMNMYNMKLEQFQVNTKFLNTLPSEWSKFVTHVKLVRDLHTTNVYQLHAYLGQHEYHANEVRLMHERTTDPLALVAQHQMHNLTYQQHQPSYHQHQFPPQAFTYQFSPYATSYHTSQYASQAPSSLNLLISYPPNDIQSSVNHNAYMASSSIPQMEYALTVHQQFELSSPETGLVVPVFQKAQTSSNPRQQATINNGRSLSNRYRGVVKNKREKDKIETKPDKNGKHGEARKSQKQLQLRVQEKLKKMQVEGPKMQIPTKLLKKEEK